MADNGGTTDDTPPVSDPAGKVPDPPKADPPSTGALDDDTRSAIRQIIQEELKGFKSTGSGAPAGPADMQARAEQMVREAAAKVAEEDAHRKAHEDLKTPTIDPEKVPKKARKLTTLLWGGDDS